MSKGRRSATRLFAASALTVVGVLFSSAGVALADTPVDVETWGDYTCAQARHDLDLSRREDSCRHIRNPGNESSWDNGWADVSSESNQVNFMHDRDAYLAQYGAAGTSGGGTSSESVGGSFGCFCGRDPMTGQP